jgi:pimeloyl-ACP methyl ester carboxylesterase
MQDEHPFGHGLARIDVNGLALAYREAGTGAPVVFVHGSGSDLRTWEHQLASFGARYRAIALSRRYARPNTDIEAGRDDPMLAHVDDLAAFLDAVDAAPAHLVGHSWGGFVALLTAVRHPLVVRSLVLMEPPVLPLFVSTPPRALELVALLCRRPAAAVSLIGFAATAMVPAIKAYRRGDDEAAIRAFGRGILGKAYYAKLSPARRQQAWDNRNADRAQLMGAGFPPLGEDEVARVEAPALVLIGEHSPAFLHHLARRLHELLPRAQLREIAGASHIMHEDNPAAVDAAILGFLGRCGS